MIHKITVINYLGERLVMDLTQPEKTGFIIMSMNGLGPEKAEIRVAEIATSDGGLYNSSRLPSRNIRIIFRFLTDENRSAEEIRHKSYKHFPIKKPITLIIETDSRVLETIGYVESNEPVIFSKETGTALSIICPDSSFHSVGSETTIFYGTEPLFEFPFSNESLTEPLLIMGEIKTRNEELIFYFGDLEVGIVIIIDALGPVKNLVIHNVRTRENMSINTDRLEAMTGYGIIASDRITISTVKGQKTISLLRSGIRTNIINVLSRGSDWFTISKGENIFAFEAEEGSENLLFRVENRVKYEGV